MWSALADYKSSLNGINNWLAGTNLVNGGMLVVKLADFNMRQILTLTVDLGRHHISDLTPVGRRKARPAVDPCCGRELPFHSEMDAEPTSPSVDDFQC